MAQPAVLRDRLDVLPVSRNRLPALQERLRRVEEAPTIGRRK
jgi:hypothetical protein